MSRSQGKRVPKLRERDGDDCKLCGKPIDFSLPHGSRHGPSVDHVVPRAAGGTGRLENLQLAHAFPCNHAKGARHNGKDYGQQDPPYGISKHYRGRNKKKYDADLPCDGSDWETPVMECWPVPDERRK